MLNTGLRVSELASLSIGHVRDRKSLEIVGKGNKIREVPLNSAIKGHINQYLAIKKRLKEGLLDNDPLFISRKQGKLSVRAIQRALDKWLVEAQIPTKFSPHALRHTFGTELFSKCKNIRLVQDLMGHADISTTMIYTHVNKAEMEEAVELLAH
jgi:integrase/recombinase XerC